MKKLLLCNLILISIATATTLKVPSQYSTIQAAIDAASAGDTVLVADGTYTENLIIDKDIKIISENGAEKTIIDGGEIKHVIEFNSSALTTRDCVLDGFTITNGGNANGSSDEAGGGINVWDGSPTLRNLIIKGNRREMWSGGGIHVTNNANPLVEGCIIKENWAKEGGGGIDIWRASAEIRNCVISNNSGNWVPAITIGTDNPTTYPSIVIMDNVEVMNHSCTEESCSATILVSNATTTLKNVSIHDNHAGPAINSNFWMDGEDSQIELRIEDSNFSNNSSSINHDGGAIFLDNLHFVEIKNSLFQGNSNDYNGGAISSWNTDTLIIDGCNFAGNIVTSESAGAITINGDTPNYFEIKNSDFRDNKSEESGGALWIGNTTGYIQNVGIFKNESVSASGGALYTYENVELTLNSVTISGNSSNNAGEDFSINGGNINVNNSIIWDDDIQINSGSFDIMYSDIEGDWDGEGNIDAAPHFIDAANGNYHIGDYSPGIGAGVYSAQFDDTWYYAPSTDLDGNPRPSPAGSNPDMGAYENPRATPQHAPEPFELVFPSDNAHVGITRHNYLDTLYFAWNQAIDPDGDKVTYRRELTGDLQEYIKFIVTSDEESTTNMYRIPYHHIEHYMHTAGVEFVQGTWTIVASDGGMDTYASNGPFLLTIDASAYAVDDEAVLPESFALHANYPNPFNPTTTISYDLPEQAQVTLGIYDVLGKQIKTLVNQSQDAGNRIAVWDGTDELGRSVSAGVYLYRIQAGEFSQTRKMLLLK